LNKKITMLAAGPSWLWQERNAGRRLQDSLNKNTLYHCLIVFHIGINTYFHLFPGENFGAKPLPTMMREEEAQYRIWKQWPQT